MKHFPDIVALGILIAGCAPQSITPNDVVGPVTWGGSDNVTHLRHLYFSEQPDADALRVAKLNGVTAVINLREPSESDWNEQVAAERHGLNYINIPIRRHSNTLDPAAIAAINTAVEAQKGVPVLLHCASGNRAAAWLAVHLVEQHQLSNEDSLAVARKAGLTRKDVARRVTAYFENNTQ